MYREDGGCIVGVSETLTVAIFKAKKPPSGNTIHNTTESLKSSITLKQAWADFC
jgi:hypothetical protein